MPVAGAVAAAALLAGALVGVSMPVASAPLRGVVPAILLLALAGWTRRFTAFTLACVAAGFWAAGAVLAATAHERAVAPVVRALLERELGGFALETLGPAGRHAPVPARVRVDEDAAWVGDVVLVRGSLEAVRVGRPWRRVPHEGIRIAVAGDAAREAQASWVAGRVLEAPVTFSRPSRYLNEGVPDHERRLALDGVALTGTVKSALLVDVAGRGTAIEERAAAVRAHVRRVVSRHVGARDAVAGSIVTAVLIGDRTGLPDAVRERLQAAGTYHVIAISGGNIAIFTALAVMAPMLAGVARRPASLLAMAVLAAYAQVVTAGPSVWRATLMATIYLLARALDHRTPPWHAVAVAAALMTAARPLDIGDPGFVLTFGATGALLAGAHYGLASMPVLTRRPGGAPRASARRGRVRRAAALAARWAIGSVLASLAVELALTPVSAQAFSRVTAAGLVLNLLAIPLMAAVQVSGMALTLLSSIDAAARTAGWIACASAVGLMESARLVELLPVLSRRVPPPGAAVVAMYYAALALLLVRRPLPRAAGGAGVVALWLAMQLGVPARWRAPAPMLDAPRLRLTVFDVGQSEAMLLESPGARPLLVDAGGAPFGEGFDVTDRVLAPALWDRGVLSLGGVLVTHGDPDHLGGAVEILGRFRPRQLWMGVPVPGHEPANRLLAEARRAGVEIRSARAGQRLAWGGARIRVLHPPEPDWERPRVRNDDSVVLEVLAGDVALLLTGDIGADVERALVPRLTAAPLRVLKVAHHGSRTSTARELLAAWHPQVAVISAGRGNRFGHPAPEVLSRLADIDARVFRTDRDGQITIETDGRQVRVRTFMGQQPLNIR